MESSSPDRVRVQAVETVAEVLLSYDVFSTSVAEAAVDGLLEAGFRLLPPTGRSETGFYVSVAASGRYEFRVAHRPRHPSQQPKRHATEMIVMACGVILEERNLEFYATLPVTVAGKPVRECSGCMQRLKNAGLL